MNFLQVYWLFISAHALTLWQFPKDETFTSTCMIFAVNTLSQVFSKDYTILPMPLNLVLTHLNSDNLMDGSLDISSLFYQAQTPVDFATSFVSAIDRNTNLYNNDLDYIQGIKAALFYLNQITDMEEVIPFVDAYNDIIYRYSDYFAKDKTLNLTLWRKTEKAKKEPNFLLLNYTVVEGLDFYDSSDVPSDFVPISTNLDKRDRTKRSLISKQELIWGLKMDIESIGAGFGSVGPALGRSAKSFGGFFRTGKINGVPLTKAIKDLYKKLTKLPDFSQQGKFSLEKADGPRSMFGLMLQYSGKMPQLDFSKQNDVADVFNLVDVEINVFDFSGINIVSELNNWSNLKSFINGVRANIQSGQVLGDVSTINNPYSTVNNVPAIEKVSDLDSDPNFSRELEMASYDEFMTLFIDNFPDTKLTKAAVIEYLNDNPSLGILDVISESEVNGFLNNFQAMLTDVKVKPSVKARALKTLRKTQMTLRKVEANKPGGNKVISDDKLSKFEPPKGMEKETAALTISGSIDNEVDSVLESAGVDTSSIGELSNSQGLAAVKSVIEQVPEKSQANVLTSLMKTSEYLRVKYSNPKTEISEQDAKLFEALSNFPGTQSKGFENSRGRTQRLLNKRLQAMNKKQQARVKPFPPKKPDPPKKDKPTTGGNGKP
ncbi:hypothetical protein BC833DRAFT_600924 [Globomyces pollinis-pini]|nr:hypothetical protein BC833DRAFT_600924 [Globomyces pollinis-pini]